MYPQYLLAIMTLSQSKKKHQHFHDVTEWEKNLINDAVCFNLTVNFTCVVNIFLFVLEEPTIKRK